MKLQRLIALISGLAFTSICYAGASWHHTVDEILLEKNQTILPPKSVDQPPAIASQQQNLVIVEPVSANCQNPYGLAFNVVVQNRSSDNIKFSVANTSMHRLHMQKYTALDEEQMKVFLVDQEKRAKRKKLLTAALGATAEVYIYNKSGHYTGEGAQELFETASVSVDELAENAMERFRGTILGEVDILPGNMHGGLIVAGKDNFGKGKEYKFDTKPTKVDGVVYDFHHLPTLDIHFGGELHSFKFQCSLQKASDGRK